MLVKDPVTVDHVAGGDVVGGVRGAVVSQLRHPTSEFRPLVDHHPVGALVLRRRTDELKGKPMGRRRPASTAKTKAYHGDHAAGPHAVVEAHPSLVVRIVAPPQEVLVARVVGSLVDHPVATVHSNGVAAAEVGMQV